MSEAGKAFKSELGKPDPELPDGLRFGPRGPGALWKGLRREIRSGWFQDGFLQLFGEGLVELVPCLEAWSFVVPPSKDRVILGRNAHGAILVLENASTGKGQVHLLDPFRVVYWTHPELRLMNLIALWLPRDELPHFRDDSVYRAWRKKHGVLLDDGDILAPRSPEGLGGEMTLSNFREEEIVEYYQTSGPIYARAFAKMGRPVPAKTSKKRKKP
jgi:hypothetical protein